MRFNKILDDFIKGIRGVVMNRVVYEGRLGRMMYFLPIDVLSPVSVDISIKEDYTEKLVVDTLYMEILGNLTTRLVSCCPICGTPMLHLNRSYCENINCTGGTKEYILNQYSAVNMSDCPQGVFDLYLNTYGKPPDSVLELCIFLMCQPTKFSIKIQHLVDNMTVETLASIQGLPEEVNEEDLEMTHISMKEIKLLLNLPNTQSNLVNLVDMSMASNSTKEYLKRLLLTNIDLLSRLFSC